MAETKFPMLSANAVVSRTEELVAKPFVIREFAGHRIALVGLTGGDGTAEIGVLDPLAAAQKVVSEARQQADVVIVVSHAGPVMDQQIADQVPGVAAIVSGGAGGAMQTAWVSKSTGVPIFRADLAMSGHAGRAMGIGKLDFDASGKLRSQSWKSQSLGPDVADDSVMAAWVQENTQQ
jgi:2',3'-cyclic-nucleotide 2'-phosphodiesterase (5'-nucleotidase family)